MHPRQPPLRTHGRNLRFVVVGLLAAASTLPLIALSPGRGTAAEGGSGEISTTIRTSPSVEPSPSGERGTTAPGIGGSAASAEPLPSDMPSYCGIPVEFHAPTSLSSGGIVLRAEPDVDQPVVPLFFLSLPAGSVEDPTTTIVAAMAQGEVGLVCAEREAGITYYEVCGAGDPDAAMIGEIVVPPSLLTPVQLAVLGLARDSGGVCLHGYLPPTVSFSGPATVEAVTPGAVQIGGIRLPLARDPFVIVDPCLLGRTAWVDLEVTATGLRFVQAEGDQACSSSAPSLSSQSAGPFIPSRTLPPTDLSDRSAVTLWSLPLATIALGIACIAAAGVALLVRRRIRA